MDPQQFLLVTNPISQNINTLIERMSRYYIIISILAFIDDRDNTSDTDQNHNYFKIYLHEIRSSIFNTLTFLILIQNTEKELMLELTYLSRKYPTDNILTILKDPHQNGGKHRKKTNKRQIQKSKRKIQKSKRKIQKKSEKRKINKNKQNKIQTKRKNPKVKSIKRRKGFRRSYKTLKMRGGGLTIQKILMYIFLLLTFYEFFKLPTMVTAIPIPTIRTHDPTTDPT